MACNNDKFLLMIKINNILKGWGNYIADEIGVLSPEIQQISAKRLSICNKCLIRQGLICNSSRKAKNIKTGVRTYGCGCVLTAKTKVLEESCPLDKW